MVNEHKYNLNEIDSIKPIIKNIRELNLYFSDCFLPYQLFLFSLN
jgi:hypothetical protein